MLLLLLLLPSYAAFPVPAYPGCGTPDRPDLCPTDLGTDWQRIGYIPSAWKDHVRPEEWVMGTGLGADQVWATTPGRTDVVIAVLDSGILWDEENLLKKHYLNAAELPLPMVGETVAETYDANGDTVFNIDDYAGDPRVDKTAGDDAADGVLDPSDLIATFSDSVDDDHNGFVDDISGWDFFFNDNDPYDDPRFDHGTFEANESMGQVDDGGSGGVCPNCMVMSLRVGDSFVAEGDNFANAVLYATDNGASLVQEALGTFSNSSLANAAMDYAWDHDVLVVGSAADENAYHPNPPGINNHGIYVHSVRYNRDDVEDASSFLQYSNNTNHGARLDASLPSEDASSGATAMAAGTAGLVISAARDQGIELRASELYQLLIGTAWDIAVSDNDDYITRPGWDEFSGWGRISAARAVAAVQAGEIPPHADLLSPNWFACYDPTGTIDIEGVVAAPRSAVASWKLRVAAGIGPAEADFQVLAEGSAATEGVLGTLDLSAVPGLDPNAVLKDYDRSATPEVREAAVNVYSVSLRLEVTDTEGHTAVSRRVIYVQRDPDRLNGWPLYLGASLESSPKLADLNGDGKDEVIQVDADGRVHALQADGSEIAGWPAWTELLVEVDPSAPGNHLNAPAWSSLSADRHITATGTPAVYDLDGDGTLEVVVATARGAVWVYEADGSTRPGFPVFTEPVTSTSPERALDDGFLGSPVIGDFDGDKTWEIAAGAMDGRIYIWKADGSPLPGWPVTLVYPGREGQEARITVPPAVGDLNGDGRDDLVVPTNEVLDDQHGALYAVSGDGSYLPNWPIRVWGIEVDALPLVGQGMHGSVSLMDLDGDGDLEIFGGALAGDFSVWDGDGTQLDTLPYAGSTYGAASNLADASFLPLMTVPAVGDFNNDGIPDPVAGGSGTSWLTSIQFDWQHLPYAHSMAVWDGATGELFPGFPRQVEDLQFLYNPAVADLDGDRKVEVLTGSGGFLLHAWNLDGVEPAGWPKFTGGWIMPSPAMGDLDGDGILEVVAGTREGRLFAWHTDTPRDGRVDWASNGHDDRNSHNYEVELPGFNAPVVEEDKEKQTCGCAANPGAGWIGTFLGLLLLRRRR